MTKQVDGIEVTGRRAPGALLIGKSWSWSGSCGGGGRGSEIAGALGTCASGSGTFFSSAGVTDATWEVAAAFS